MYRQTGTIDRWFLELPKPPIIKITPDAYAMSMAYVDGCKKEIGWLCHVSEIKEEYIIDDCFLPEQEVAGATCEFTEAGTANIMTEVIQAKGIEYYNQIKCWAHSHVDMAARPSAQDKNQILKWKENDYFIMLITNKKGEFYAEFYDFKNKVAFNNLSVELYHPDQKSYNRKAAEEIKKKVSDIKPPESKFVVGGGARSIPGQMSFISTSRDDKFDALAYAHKTMKDKYPEGLKVAEDEECVYERPSMKVIPPAYFDEDDEDDYGENISEMRFPIPGLEGEWEEGEFEQFKLWEFSKGIYDLGMEFPEEVTYEKIIKTLLHPSGLPTMGNGPEIKGLIKLADKLDAPTRKYIFNHVFNHNKYDEEVIDGVMNLMQYDSYINEVAIIMDEEIPYGKDFLYDVMVTDGMVTPEAAPEFLLVLPLFLGASYSDKIKDHDDLIEYVENVMLDKWVAGFLKDYNK